jgi:hypothetical protein
VEPIKLAPGAEDVPLALMLSEMLGGNLDRPEKLKAFNTLATKAYVLAQDVGAEVTMVFERGVLTFYGGKPFRPDLSIETNSATLLDLANLNIRFGMPYYFDEIGRSILKKLARRELKINGMFTHPIALTKLTKIMSIN